MGVDAVVVGGGSAGCVLAARLSEDEGRSVVLLEAGEDYAALAELPPDVVNANEPTFGHDWGYVAEPDELDRAIPLPRARLIGGCYFHPVGTCAMGSVVDARGAVHAVDGLTVADASVMPTIPSANTNLPAMMVAERMSGWLRED